MNFLNIEQAQGLTDRIATRTEQFQYTMSEPERDAMAQLLSDIGVSTSDLIDVSNLADNYAINAEIVSPDESEDYDNLEDSLFQWEESDGTHYCLSW